MKRKHSVRISIIITMLVFTLIATAGCSNGGADVNYPAKPIEFIIPFGAGGDADQVARVLAKGMQDVLKQPVVCVNKVGGGGSLAFTEVKNAANDGYTIVWATTALLSSSNMGNLDYDYS